MIIDPFSLKSRYQKTNPIRLAITAVFRAHEAWAALRYRRYTLPDIQLNTLPQPPLFNTLNTSVTVLQMQHILAALKHTDQLSQTCVVEVGAWRGETTRCIARSTHRQIFAIDPYIGYGGVEKDLETFQRHTAELTNVTLLRQTSGEASRLWHYGIAGMVFIDAVHDFANTSFDAYSWSRILAPGGLMLFHDVDMQEFPGCRRAAYHAAQILPVWAKTDNLLILQKTH